MDRVVRKMDEYLSFNEVSDNYIDKISFYCEEDCYIGINFKVINVYSSATFLIYFLYAENFKAKSLLNFILFYECYFFYFEN